MKSNDQHDETEGGAKAKLRFTTRLTPKKEATTDSQDLGLPVVSELQIRLPVGVAAGRSHAEVY